MNIPTVENVARIAGISDPVIRNLNITQGYYELSQAMSKYTDGNPNWCTFAVCECGFCHSPYHKKELGRIPMESCCRCHPFVRDMLLSASGTPMNIHDTFQEKSCTACHDPHAAEYHYTSQGNTGKLPPGYYKHPSGIFSVIR